MHLFLCVSFYMDRLLQLLLHSDTPSSSITFFEGDTERFVVILSVDGRGKGRDGDRKATAWRALFTVG